MTQGSTKKVVQIARRIGLGGGVEGVAFNIEQGLIKEGYNVDRLTLKETGFNHLPLVSKLPPKVLTAAEVLYFSFVSPIVYRMRYRNIDHVSVSHNDALVGDIYVNHGIHKLAIKQADSPTKMLIRNPLHAFMLMRERLRYLVQPHKLFVDFSKEAESEHRGAYRLRRPVVIIPNGVDTNRFFPSNELRIAGRASLGVSPDELLVLFVGHEFERKGLSIILNALAALPPSVKLVVAGGHTRAICKAEADINRLKLSDRVILCGKVSELNTLYNAADVFCILSSQEIWGLVSMEAMAAGTPVINAPTVGAFSFVQQDRNGWVVERQPVELKILLENLLQSGVPEEMKTFSRETADQYSWARVVESYQQLVESVARPEVAGT